MHANLLPVRLSSGQYSCRGLLQQPDVETRTVRDRFNDVIRSHDAGDICPPSFVRCDDDFASNLGEDLCRVY